MPIFAFNKDQFTYNKQNRTLSTLHKSPILILFSYNGSAMADENKKYFKQLSDMCKIVEYAIVDLDKNQNDFLRTISTNSTTPINSITTIILYNDGKPIAKITPVDAIKMKSSLEKALNQHFTGNDTSTPQMNMYGGGNTQQRKVFFPTDLKQPNVKIQGVKNIQDNYLENDKVLTIPEDFIPYNNPWIAENYEE